MGGHLDELGDDLVFRLESCSWRVMKDKTQTHTQTDKVSSILNNQQVSEGGGGGGGGGGDHCDELGDNIIVRLESCSWCVRKDRDTHSDKVSSILNKEQVRGEVGSP